MGLLCHHSTRHCNCARRSRILCDAERGAKLLERETVRDHRFELDHWLPEQLQCFRELVFVRDSGSQIDFTMQGLHQVERYITGVEAYIDDQCLPSCHADGIAQDVSGSGGIEVNVGAHCGQHAERIFLPVKTFQAFTYILCGCMNDAASVQPPSGL